MQEAEDLAVRQRALKDAKQRLQNERKGLEMAQVALETSLSEVRSRAWREHRLVPLIKDLALSMFLKEYIIRCCTAVVARGSAYTLFCTQLR